jgi:site-specific DNA recombinase
MGEHEFNKRAKSKALIRDQTRADEARARHAGPSQPDRRPPPRMLTRFAAAARDRMRLPGGGFRRDHLRALAQRIEVAEGEVRIIGSKSRLRQTLSAQGSGNAVPTQGLKWRKRWDSNPRTGSPVAGFQDQSLKPLGHTSCACGAVTGGIGARTARGFARARPKRACPAFLAVRRVARKEA